MASRRRVGEEREGIDRAGAISHDAGERGQALPYMAQMAKLYV